MNFTKVFSAQHNHFHVIRHLAAMAVIVDHAFIINGHGHLLARFGAKTSLGAIGVGVFFILSGALVTGSYLNCCNAIDFVVRRVRRIYPAYLVCLLATAFFLYPLITYATRTGTAEFGWLDSEGPLRYVLNNSLTVQWQNRINELFGSNPEAHSVNGSLWSISWEMACYFMVLCFGVLGILRKSPWVVCVCLVAAFLNVCIFPAGSFLGKYYLSERITYLPILFLSGMTFFLFRERIRYSRLVALVSLALFLASLFIDWRLAILLLPYALFGLAYSERALRTDLPDLSYGMYIYGFPIQQSIWLCFGNQFSIAMQLVLGIILVLPVAAASWYLVERPWLKRKTLVKATCPA